MAVVRPTSHGATAPSFEEAWAAASHKLRRTLVKQFRDEHLVDEVLQDSYLRASRGYAQFRGGSFLSWVLKTARRVAYDLFRKNSRVVFEAPPDVAAPIVEAAVSPPGNLLDVVSEAAKAGLVTDKQAKLLREWSMKAPQEGWEVIATRLGISATSCAVEVFRGLTNLRVYLFIHRADVLGGRNAIHDAFEEALIRRVDPLTELEAAAFRRVVLERSAPAKGTGSLESLRKACTKVALFLDFPYGT